MNEVRIPVSCLQSFGRPDEAAVRAILNQESRDSRLKIIALDDDPTGVQTVHDVSVYTDWSEESIRAGFAEKNSLFFILTNSRGFTREQTTQAHLEIAEAICRAAEEKETPFLIINRSDSTLRGHYPLETQLVKQVMEKHGFPVDGEILCPYFREGGRFTIDDVHYVRYGEELVPAGQTEFARDETFGYHSSNLKEYVEEKTEGAFRKEDCISIPLRMLRTLDFQGIEKILRSVTGFRKIIVNAVDDVDVRIFAIALLRAMKAGKHFTIRSAAALVKAIGNISDQPLLTREKMVTLESPHGGIIAVGSHTAKTTAQLEELKKNPDIYFIEMNSDLVLIPGALDVEVENILRMEEALIRSGKTVCVSTRRTLLKVENDTPEQALLRSVAISDALQKCVGRLTVTPAFVIAKGGITSSDVGVKALRVKRANVLGQIQPGIPVWQTGRESLFPATPYVIFPGNVGDVDTLRKAAEVLMQ